jgi:hypothetical protein
MESRISEFFENAPIDLVFDSESFISIDTNGDGEIDEVRRAIRPHPTDETRVLFAAGDLDGVIGLERGATGLVASRFLITPGVTDQIVGDAVALMLPDLDRVDATRSARGFLRRETWTDLGAAKLSDITDRGLYVVNPSQPLIALTHAGQAAPGTVVPGGAEAAVLHADFGLAYVGAQQVSSISATIGKIDFRLFIEKDSTIAVPHLAVDAVVSAKTVASSSARDGKASTLITSDFRSTAAGGGNPNIDDDKRDGADPGRLGFFVFQNAGQVFDDIAAPSPRTLPGGVERPLGADPQASDLRYSLIRLASASDSFVPDLRNGFSGGLAGYATGWVEIERNNGGSIELAPFARIDDGPNLEMSDPDQDLNLLTATITHGGRELSFGGPGLSAYVDDLTYGLLSTEPESAMAIISAEPIGRELSGRFKTTEGAIVPIPIRDPKNHARHPQDKPYKHVQWGFFFGDAITREGRRQHMHLGTYAAGSPIDRAQLDQARGTATYQGHAIGNVYNGGKVYSSVGTLTERFDFNRRAGETTLDFDRRKYAGTSKLSGEAYSSSVATRDRSGRLNGRFVGGISGRPRQPNALVGGFELMNRSARPRTAYRATGTFGAERR